MALLVLLAAAGTWWSLKRAPQNATAPAPPVARAPIVPANSVAIFPFENLSDDKESGFFAAALHDDLVTTLRKRDPELRVVAHSSLTASGEKGGRNLREIRKESGVATVLERSVRRVEDRVVFNVQVSDTATGGQIWAEQYDRTWKNLIGLQGELASMIAGSLRARFTADDKIPVQLPEPTSAPTTPTPTPPAK